MFSRRVGRSLARLAPLAQPRRNLNVHEYVAQQIMSKYGVGAPRGVAAETAEEAVEGYKSIIGDGEGVIKAQVLAGGRGLGHFVDGSGTKVLQGGVHMCSGPADAKEYASKMLGKNLVTKQTTDAGLTCNKVFVVEKVDIEREMYLSILLDRAAQGPMIIASPAGGTSIEDVAEATPELITTQAVDIMEGLTADKATEIATFLNFIPGSAPHAACVELLLNMYDMFCKTDATMIEVNPLGQLTDGRVLACDAKVLFDDNADFRQKEIFLERDLTQEDPREVEADQAGMNYVHIGGNIGCLVNGAGLAMSTMDLIFMKGGAPANFLDVGGGSQEEQIVTALRLLEGDSEVKSMLVCIFGGIMRCDIIARGIIGAASKISLSKPLVVRLAGTNSEEAKALLEASGIASIVPVHDFEAAAEKAVELASG